jgi:hypothetical protein
MAADSNRKVVAVDCPLDEGDEGISQFMCDNRSAAGGLYDRIRSRGLEVIQLVKPTLSALQQAVSDPWVVFVTASGHGTSDGMGFVRDQYENLLYAGEHFYDRRAFNRKIVHLFACDTAKCLGPDLLGPNVYDLTGVCAFLGYNADFSFAQKYNQDPTLASQFIDCDSAIDLALADGASPEQAFGAAALAFKSLISQWQLEKDHVSLAGLLQQDFEALSLGLFNIAGAIWKTGKELP